jgi:hypothetical protein
MASEACVEPTKTMMMPITREQPHAASARISLYTGMGSGGRLCTSPSFHNIADPSRLSVSTASSPSRFAIRIRGLWAKAITVPRALSRRQLSASPRNQPSPGVNIGEYRFRSEDRSGAGDRRAMAQDCAR